MSKSVHWKGLSCFALPYSHDAILLGLLVCQGIFFSLKNGARDTETSLFENSFITDIIIILTQNISTP